MTKYDIRFYNNETETEEAAIVVAEDLGKAMGLLHQHYDDVELLDVVQMDAESVL